ncbi:MAG: HNH endonuclease [Defluviitaleaceae bacterium]|nr:HNH endonuclease [Defluviitaleaceae bacterium]
MKDWAKSFYQSKAWIKCRKSYLISANYLCERCNEIAVIAHHRIYLTPHNINDPTITLAHSNLEALCQDCHNKEHHKAVRQAGRYAFDEAGNVVQPPSSPPIVDGS